MRLAAVSIRLAESHSLGLFFRLRKNCRSSVRIDTPQSLASWAGWNLDFAANVVQVWSNTGFVALKGLSVVVCVLFIPVCVRIEACFFLFI